jgi:hypothetical protein
MNFKNYNNLLNFLSFGSATKSLMGEDNLFFIENVYVAALFPAYGLRHPFLWLATPLTSYNSIFKSENIPDRPGFRGEPGGLGLIPSNLVTPASFTQKLNIHLLSSSFLDINYLP